MDKMEYELIQNLMIGQASVIEEVDLGAFIANINKAESVAPIIDPSLWKRGGNRMQKIKRLAQAYQGVQKAYRELNELVAAEEAAARS